MTAEGRSSILGAFGDVVRRMPDQIAVSAPDAQVTYRALWVQVQAAAAALRRAGLRPGDLVHIAGPTGARQLAHLLAAWTCGAVVWLEDGRASRESSAAPAAPALRVSLDSPSAPMDIGPCEALPVDVASAVGQLPSRRRDVLAAAGGYLVRSSGSTGRRKLILGSYRSLSAFIAWQRTEFGVSERDRVAAVTDVGFDVVYRELLVTVTSGATLVCPPVHIRPSAIPAWLAHDHATVVHVVPSLARFWLTASAAGSADTGVSPDLRVSFFAGEPLDGELARQWWQRTGDRQTIVNLYGPSETTLAKFSYRVPRATRRSVVPVGKPLPGTSVALRDTKTGGPVGDGQLGEVVIATSEGTLGYLGDVPDHVATKFRRAAGVVTFETGDVGRLQGDELVLLGRVDSLLKVNGVWVDPIEVARVLREHDAVEDSVVLAVWTSRGVRLHAFVATPHDVPAQTLRTQVLRELGATHVPAYVTILRELPRLSNGKTDRLRLLSLARHDHEGEESTVNQAIASAESLTAKICEVMTSALGVEVRADDNMLDRGLDSLAALELYSVLDGELQIPCTLEEVFENPVPQDFARMLLERLTAA
jgi:acyl-coenzyme A synthetase/AMP-(fatty) acid ligase/acyl carrier protein